MVMAIAFSFVVVALVLILVLDRIRLLCRLLFFLSIWLYFSVRSTGIPRHGNG